MHKTENPSVAGLLRFLAAGSVDDGKSTLIGRLLYDTKTVATDQLEAVTRASQQQGKNAPDLSFFTDGLKSEREQGITIDVAYRYFTTSRRKFIVADTPGHWEYTRNMVTGASNADLMLILVDARHGLVAQTHRHTLLASLLGIKHLILCVNKMDAVGYREERFSEIVSEFHTFTQALHFTSITPIPLSALQGDNVVEQSLNMPWYSGTTLLEKLETVDVTGEEAQKPFRFPVQLAFPEKVGVRLAGRIDGGSIQAGDFVTVLPSGDERRIERIETMDGVQEIAQTSDSVSIILSGEKTIARGEMLAAGALPRVSAEVQVQVCWFRISHLLPGQKFVVKHTTRFVKGEIIAILSKTEISTLREIQTSQTLETNEIGKVQLKTEEPLYFDAFSENKITGSLIFIHPETFETVGAGMIL
jgi:sulfate adenylyltransferase subunit 1